MIKDTTSLFESLLKTAEVKKVDFKASQYRLDNDVLKSEFAKDILCMANASGDEGYILLGVKSEKGQPKEVVGISDHHDSSALEAIVNGVIDPPIQFEYHPINYKGKECALLHIPKSTAKPHWSKRDYGKLKRRVIYTRRSSGNREASIQEIRAMCVETMQLSDIAHSKVKTSPHVVDELKDLSLDERTVSMFKMLKRITKKIGLKEYRLEKYSFFAISKPIFAVFNTTIGKTISEYAVLMYPWTATGNKIFVSRRSLIEKNGISTRQTSSQIKARLKESSLIHIAYKNIYTKTLEKWAYDSTGYWFANKWTEPWGIAIKWEDEWGAKGSQMKRVKYEFFLPNVSSEEELRDRIEKLLLWAKDKIT